MSKVRVSVDVDIDDVLYDAGAEELAKYIHSAFGMSDRVKMAKLILARKPGERDDTQDDDTLTPLVQEAFAELRAGRTQEAMTVLERALWPKWKTPEAGLLAFRAAKQ